MDASLIAVGVVVLVVVALFFLRGGDSKKDDNIVASENWRIPGSLSVDPVLRNRHGIQNGEVRQWGLAEIAKHNKKDDMFIIVQNKVYDLSDFVEDHPGGLESVLRNPGADNTEKFSGIQHPAKVWDMIQEYYVGDVKKDEQTVYTFKNVSPL